MPLDEHSNPNVCMPCNYQHYEHCVISYTASTAPLMVDTPSQASHWGFKIQEKKEISPSCLSLASTSWPIILIVRHGTLTGVRTWCVLSHSTYQPSRPGSRPLKDKCQQINGNAICSLLSELTCAADWKWRHLKRKKDATDRWQPFSSCTHMPTQLIYTVCGVHKKDKVCCLIFRMCLQNPAKLTSRWLCPKVTNIYCSIQAIHILIWLFLLRDPYLPVSDLLPVWFIQPLCISSHSRRKAISPREGQAIAGRWKERWRERDRKGKET